MCSVTDHMVSTTGHMVSTTGHMVSKTEHAMFATKEHPLPNQRQNCPIYLKRTSSSRYIVSDCDHCLQTNSRLDQKGCKGDTKYLRYKTP